MGVAVRGYNYRYPHNNDYFSLYTPLVLALFWQQHPYFFVHFLCFFVLVIIIIVIFAELLRSEATAGVICLP